MGLILAVFQNLQRKEKRPFIYDNLHQGNVSAGQTFVPSRPGGNRDGELHVFWGVCVEEGGGSVKRAFQWRWGSQDSAMWPPPPLCPPPIVPLAVPVVGGFPSLKDSLGHEFQHSHLINGPELRSLIYQVMITHRPFQWLLQGVPPEGAVTDGHPGTEDSGRLGG